jgi:NAD(P)H dehydrogenase (quinone)
MARQILITGATGKTGAYAVSTLLDQGHHVRALVRQVDDRSERLARSGAEVVVADLHDVDAVSRAAKGIDAAYLTPIPIGASPGLQAGDSRSDHVRPA